jgi:hypothetical protein
MLDESGMNLLVFRKGELIFSSGKHGIIPIIEALDSLELGDNRSLVTADRIVGRAAGLLNLYMGVSEVHTLLISTGAKELLKEHGIHFQFKEETDAIKMKDGVIFCPFERLVQDISDPKEAYVKIKAKLEQM